MSGKDIFEETAEEIKAESEQTEEKKLAEQPRAEEEDLRELERENAQLKQQLLRLKADHMNFRRRSESQKNSIILEANEKLLQDLLPVLDSLERALAAQQECTQGETPFFAGVQMISQNMLDILAFHGLETIDAAGGPFDPRYHDAISMEGDGGAPLVVTEEIQTGYLLNGKVIRHAKVLVGQNEEAEECQK